MKRSKPLRRIGFKPKAVKFKLFDSQPAPVFRGDVIRVTEGDRVDVLLANQGLLRSFRITGMGAGPRRRAKRNRKPAMKTSGLAHPKTARPKKTRQGRRQASGREDLAYLAFVRTLTCVVCGATPAERSATCGLDHARAGRGTTEMPTCSRRPLGVPGDGGEQRQRKGQ